MRRFTIIVFVLVVVALGNGIGISEQEKSVWNGCEADFIYEDAHMYVSMMLNDKGPFKFAFDNGWEYSSITSSAAQKSGAGQTPATVKLGNRMAKGATFQVTPTPFAPNTDGMLASDFARAFVITIDYPKRKIYVMDKKVFAGERQKIKKARHIKAEVAGPFLIVKATLDGKGPYKFCHDTGTNGDFVLLPKHANEGGFGTSGTLDIKLVSIEAIKGEKPLEYKNRSKCLFIVNHIGVTTYAGKYNYHGTIGNTIFQDDKITLDYEKEQIIVWEKEKKDAGKK